MNKNKIKKNIILSGSLALSICAMILSTVGVSAATYSKAQSRNLTVSTATYKVGETAVYHTSGDTRWSYTNLTKTYVSGNSGRGVSLSSATTSSSSTSITQTTKRTLTLKMTDNSYQTHTASTYFTWTFDTVNKVFK